jgi:hypothetical protein
LRLFSSALSWPNAPVFNQRAKIQGLAMITNDEMNSSGGGLPKLRATGPTR